MAFGCSMISEGVLPEVGLNDIHDASVVAVQASVPVPVFFTCTERDEVGLGEFGSTVKVATVGLSDNKAGCAAVTTNVTLTVAVLFAPVTVT